MTHELQASAPVRPPVLGRILVVDDLPANLQLMASIFEPSGYEVCSCATIDEALGALQQKRPDVIISDVHLMNQSGYEFVRLVKNDSERSAIPSSVWQGLK